MSNSFVLDTKLEGGFFVEAQNSRDFVAPFFSVVFEVICPIIPQLLYPSVVLPQRTCLQDLGLHYVDGSNIIPHFLLWSISVFFGVLAFDVDFAIGF